MTAAALWLEGERPPLPRRMKADAYVGKHRAPDWDDTDVLSSPVARFRPWPAEEPTETGVRAVTPRGAAEPRTVEFRAVKPPRWSRRWWRENLTWPRQVAGGMSGLVLLAGFVGRWFM